MCRIARTHLKVEFCRKHGATVEFLEISFVRGCLPKTARMSGGALWETLCLSFYVVKQAMHGLAARKADKTRTVQYRSAHFLLNLAALSLSECSIFSNRPLVPVVREGFVVKEAAVPKDNMTAFLPEGDTIDLYGSMI